jgi:endoglucanase
MRRRMPPRRWWPPIVLVGLVAVLGLIRALGTTLRTQPDLGDVVARVATMRPDQMAECRLDPAGLDALPPRPDGRPAVTFHTCGAHILNQDGQSVQITGVSWFGMETGTYAPHGLWTRNWKAMLDQIAALGFNTVRLPFSDDAIVPGRMPQSINYELNPDLAGKTSLDVMDTLIQGAGDRGLKIILDRHRPTSEAQSELWYTDAVSEEQWLHNWVALAQRYRGNTTVLGVDLHNEPRGPATWASDDVATDWRLAAERAGNAILDVNPYLLIFVQGIERDGDDWYWWGGNLHGAGAAPVRLNVPARVVYSPHDYGPGVYGQPWFETTDFPANLPSIWDAHWGYLAKEQLAPVVLGEFGGRSVGDDAEGIWQRALMAYAHQNGIGWLNWSFNPDSSDTGGLLADDWLTVEEGKAQVYRDHLAPPLDVGSSGAFGQARGQLLVRTKSSGSNNLSFVAQVVNDSGVPINLGDLELRYGFKPGPLGTRTQVVDIDYAAVGNGNVIAAIGPTDQDGVAALRISFAPQAGTIQPYATSGEIMLRVHKSDWSNYEQQGDLSQSLYQAGRLVWGN